jgi:hypothetical protein
MSPSHLGAYPYIRWNEIHQTFKSASFDSLILLDCFYSTQTETIAGKGTIDGLPVRTWLLAAAGGRNETKQQSRKSYFTYGMQVLMREQIAKNGCVEISELYLGLIDGMNRSDGKPFMIIGPSIQDIILERIRAPGEREDNIVAPISNMQNATPAGHQLAKQSPWFGRDYVANTPTKLSYGVEGRQKSPIFANIPGFLDPYMTMPQFPINPTVQSRPETVGRQGGRFDPELVHSSTPSSTTDGTHTQVRCFAQRLIDESKTTPGLERLSSIRHSKLIVVLREFAWRLHGESANFRERALSREIDLGSE